MKKITALNGINIILVIVVVAAVLSTTTVVLNTVYGIDFGEAGREDQEQFVEKLKYLCLKLDELGGLGEMLIEDQERCKKFIEDMDIFEKNELLKKYDR
jgi:hypothetical protein